MLRLCPLVGLLLQAASLQAAAQLLPITGYFIVVHRFDCHFNPQYLSQVKCDVTTPLNRSVNVELMLLQNIKAIVGSARVSIPNPKKKTLQKIFDITFEACKVLKEKKRKTLIDILHSITKFEGDNMHCPFKRGHFQARNITLAESLPPILTESVFTIDFNWYLPRGATIMNVSVLANIFDISKDRSKRKKYG